MLIVNVFASPRLLIAGLVCLVIGWLLRSWASRHDLLGVATDAAISATWKAARTRSTPGVPEEITSRLDDLKADGSKVGQAKKVAGYAARHALAQVAGWGGLLLLLAGLVLAGLGVWWK